MNEGFIEIPNLITKKYLRNTFAEGSYQRFNSAVLPKILVKLGWSKQQWKDQGKKTFDPDTSNILKDYCDRKLNPKKYEAETTTTIEN